MDLKRDRMSQLEVIEGNFLTIQCDVDKIEKSDENMVNLLIK